jgi:hypothetical protein
VTLPDHLFVSDSGDLHDTRDADWSSRVLRARYKGITPRPETFADIKAALRAGEFTSVGGYPLYFLMGDNEAMSFDSARRNIDSICYAMQHEGPRDSWRIVGIEINYEDDELYCVHNNSRIPSAYGAPDEEQAA